MRLPDTYELKFCVAENSMLVDTFLFKAVAVKELKHHNDFMRIHGYKERYYIEKRTCVLCARSVL